MQFLIDVALFLMYIAGFLLLCAWTWRFWKLYINTRWLKKIQEDMMLLEIRIPRDVMNYARSKGLKNALCLYAFKGNKEYDAVWEEASRLKDLDIFGCDPYWRWRGHQDPAKHVADFTRHTVQLARAQGKGSQIWIQAMRLPAGAESEVERACEAAAKEGATHLAAWSFDGGELLDPVLSERPGEVWKSVESVYKRLRDAR